VPAVSIITPTYNREDVIERCLNSVQSQTFTDAEHIVIDDGSTDNTKLLIEDYSISNIPIKFEKLDKNSGANVARNRGLTLADGDFITFLDSDDEYLPDRLEVMTDLLVGTDYVGGAHGYTIINRSNIQTLTNPPEGKIELDLLRSGNPIGTLSSTIFTHDVIKKVGGFDTNFPSSQDYEFYLRVLDCGDLVGTSSTLLRYYRRDDAISANPKAKATAQSLLWEKHGDKLSDDLRARQKYTLGHGYATIGDMSKAKQCFGRSFRYKPSILSGYHYALCLLGKKKFDAGVDLKHRIHNMSRSIR